MKSDSYLNLKMFKIEHLTCLDMLGPTNFEDPCNIFLETLNMGSIYSRKHEMACCCLVASKVVAAVFAADYAKLEPKWLRMKWHVANMGSMKL